MSDPSSSRPQLDLSGAAIQGNVEEKDPTILLPNQSQDFSHLSLDIGGSLIKLVYFSRHEDQPTEDERGRCLKENLDGSRRSYPILGGMLHFVKFETTKINECLDFIYSKQLHHGGMDPQGWMSEAQGNENTRIKATGGGAYKFADMFKEMLGVSIEKEDEMNCLVSGANFLLKAIRHEAFTHFKGQKKFVQIDHNDLFPYLLVNIGSGVSMIKVDGDGKYERVSGTNVGGGTFWGLGRLLTKCKSFDELLELSQQGDNRELDKLVEDIYGGDCSKIGLSKGTIAASFGKPISDNKELEDYRPEDISMSLLRMISNNIGQIAYLNALRFKLKRILFGGFFIRGHAYTMDTISDAVHFWSKGDAKAMFLRHEGFLGALGAFMSYEKHGLDDLMAHQFVERFPMGAPSEGGKIHGPSPGNLSDKVILQRMNGAEDQRDVEGNGIATVKSLDRSLRSKFSDHETDENRNCNSVEDGTIEITSSQQSEPKEILIVRKGSDDVSASGSESSSERNTPQELGLRSNIHRDSDNFLSPLRHSFMPHKSTTNAIITNYLEHQRSNTEWSVGSAPDGSIDDLTNSSEDSTVKERSPHASEASVEKLKNDLVIFARQAEVSELELQTLKKQIVKESKRGQDLSREVISLKEERDALKEECKQLKGSHKHTDGAKVSSKLQFESEDPHTLLQELRQELNHEKDLNVNLRIQLQKTQESNSELILAVQDLDEMLEQKNKDTSYFSNKSAANGNAKELQDMVSNQETDEDEEQHALESLVKEHDDARETYLLERKIVDLYSEIEVYRRDRDELEMQMEQLALDYEILKQENHDLLSKLEQNHLQEQLKAQYDCSDSLLTISDLETQVESLEKELVKQEEDLSTSLITINELKFQVECLEKEMEKQAQGFEADLEDVMHAKVEQEQRAIRAEEALRKTRLTNANTAERLQEEFRRLSVQMASTFDANEKLAMKAVTEASELRLQKSHLEEMLEKVTEDLDIIRDHYEDKLKELSDQLSLSKEHAERSLSELEEKSKKLEHQKEQDEEMCRAFSVEILMLRDEIERLTENKNKLSKQVEENANLQIEIEILKASLAESELLVQRVDGERNELEKTVALVRKEADKFLEELNSMRSLKDEKETSVGILLSEVETLKAEYNKLKNILCEEELEKESLSKQVFDLKGDLKKKEELITSTEKKLKAVSDGTKSSKNNKVAPGHGSKEVAGLRERMKLLQAQIKLKETALENSNVAFLEKEKDLLYRIDELENRMVVFNSSSTSCCDDQLQKIQEVKSVETPEISSKNEGINTEKLSSDSEVGDNAKLPDQNGIKSTNKLSLNKLLIATSVSGDHRDLDELLSEMASMKAKNESMEGELKDMQERYSELSLKFAEVEGERQQLVMTVRNLKNVKRT